MRKLHKPVRPSWSLAKSGTLSSLHWQSMLDLIRWQSFIDYHRLPKPMEQTLSHHPLEVANGVTGFLCLLWKEDVEKLQPAEAIWVWVSGSLSLLLFPSPRARKPATAAVESKYVVFTSRRPGPKKGPVVVNLIWCSNQSSLSANLNLSKYGIIAVIAIDPSHMRISKNIWIVFGNIWQSLIILNKI